MLLRLCLAVFVVSALSVRAQKLERIPIDELMTAQERKATGIDRLRVSEKAALEEWLWELLNEVYQKGIEDAIKLQMLTKRMYPGVGMTHWIRRVMAGGDLILLEDGSVWKVFSMDRIHTVLWLPSEEVVVLEAAQPVGEFGYILVNTSNGTQVYAKYIGRQ